MLGAEGARDYLMVFQNNAEIRATGGLPGAVSLLHADRGTLTMTRQVAANEFGRTDQPVLPLTDGEREVYDDKVGTWFLNANLQPDFPRAAELWKARWEQVHPERIDGVVSLDPIALSYVLGATGPIEVDGVQLSEETAVDELLHRVYLRLEDPADQDEFFRAVASAMFDVMTAGAGEPRALLRALATGAKEGRVTVHSFEDTVQQHLAGTAIAGEAVKSVGDRPQVGVYLSDATGAKMSYFLRYETTVEATYCANGMQGISGRLRLTSTAPADAGSLPDYVTGGGYAGVEPGTQRVFVRLFGPLDGEIDKLVLDGEPITDSPVVDYDGRGVVTAVVELAPGQTSDLTWTMRTGVDQVGPIDVSVTPSVQPGSSSFRSGSACS